MIIQTVLIKTNPRFYVTEITRDLYLKDKFVVSINFKYSRRVQYNGHHSVNIPKIRNFCMENNNLTKNISLKKVIYHILHPGP